MTILEGQIPEGQSRSYGKERILLQIGKGSVTAVSIVRRAYPDLVQVSRLRKSPSSVADHRLWMVGGDPDIPYSLAKCCMSRLKSVATKDLVAYVSSEHVIRIHHKTCSHVRGKSSSRMLAVDAKT